MKEILPPVPTVNVLDIPIFNGSIDDATEILLQAKKTGVKSNRCISATGAHGLVTARRDPSFRKVLKSFYINLPDGMPGVWVGRLKGAKRIERCYGPDFFEDVMKKTANTEIRHYFCGGKETVPESLQKACAVKFGNNNIYGTYSPPFRELAEDEIKELADDINSRNTDVVWIGISTPKQEKFALRLSKYCNVHFLITVGAAFDFHIGNVRQAPRILQRNGLEWLFRLCVEPKRLWKRYFEIVPLFIYYNFTNIFNTKNNI